MLPAGLEYVDSWVDLEFSKCFQLMRTTDAALLDAWIGEWNDLVAFEVVAVQSSAEAGRAMAGEQR